MGQAVAARKIEATTAVRVSLEVAEAVAKRAPERPGIRIVRSWSFLESYFEPLIEKMYGDATKRILKNNLAQIEETPEVIEKVMVRVPRSQVVRLGVVKAVTGRGVGDMLEELAWKWVRRATPR